MPIHVLPEEVASQIAAGEVVERPASVVKELVENALDAGARTVSIVVNGAGRRLIEVADDGAGIPENEASLAVARHATSKLNNAEDLFHITTLGFRGEALASIASVSRLTLTTRPVDQEAGLRLGVEGGEIVERERVGAPIGTTVRVEELFYNVPARLKFLKQDVTERQAIDALVTRYALAYPNVRFSLIHEGRLRLHTSGNGDRREALAALYGLDVARQMLEVIAGDEEIELSGFISPVTLTRSNRREITFFINGRWVQDMFLAAALLKAYHTLLMVGRYPLAVLFVDLPPEQVDVNVHPAKAEVRFREPDRVFAAVQRGVRRALLAYSPVPVVAHPSFWNSDSGPTAADTTWGTSADARTRGTGDEPEETGAEQEGLASPVGEQATPVGQQALPGSRLPLLRVIGQVGAAYLVAEGPDGLYLIDQHAAHERVLFERFMDQRNSAISSQALLDPAVVRLPPQAAQLLEAQIPLLSKLGFRIEEFGPGTFLVRAIPALLSGSDPASAVRVVVEEFEEDETPLQSEVEARIIARVCKRAAVKAGQTLSAAEQLALVADLERCRSPRTCPHGRPTMIHLSVDLLERQFGRRGPR